MIVACLALMFAVAGTSIAATQISKNSVGAKELGNVKLRSASDGVAGGDVGDTVATCKRGEQLLGGGATFSGVTALEGADIDLSYPDGKKAWAAGGYNGDGVPHDLVVTAICLKK